MINTNSVVHAPPEDLIKGGITEKEGIIGAEFYECLHQLILLQDYRSIDNLILGSNSEGKSESESDTDIDILNIPAELKVMGINFTEPQSIVNLANSTDTDVTDINENSVTGNLVSPGVIGEDTTSPIAEDFQASYSNSILQVEANALNNIVTDNELKLNLGEQNKAEGLHNDSSIKNQLLTEVNDIVTDNELKLNLGEQNKAEGLHNDSNIKNQLLTEVKDFDRAITESTSDVNDNLDKDAVKLFEEVYTVTDTEVKDSIKASVNLDKGIDKSMETDGDNIADKLSSGEDINSIKGQATTKVENSNVEDIYFSMNGLATDKEVNVISKEPVNISEHDDNIVRIQESIVELVDSTKDGNTDTMKVKLYPEELGTVDIVLQMEEGKVTAKIMVETEFLKQIFDSKLGDLSKNLMKQDVNLEKLQVDLSNSGRQSNDENNKNSFYKKNKMSNFVQSGYLESGNVSQSSLTASKVSILA